MLGSIALALLPAVPAAERPNIVLVYSDDHAQNALGCYGSRLAPTPNLDRLAAEGMRFAQSFVGNSICAPARATVLTGQHTHVHGVIDNGKALRDGQVTFPMLLGEAGYQTALIGKWHLKKDPVGFDHFEVLLGQGPYYNPKLRSADGEVVREGYTTEIITERAIRWLREERDGERPFLLMVQNKAPHREWSPGPKQMDLFTDRDLPEPATLFDDYEGRCPGAAAQEMTIERHMYDFDLKFTAPKNLTEAQLEIWNAAYGPRNAAFEAAGLEGDDVVRWRYQRYIKDYMRCITAVDDAMGLLLDELEAQELAGDTIVIYTSDQGFYLGEHGWYDKRWMYEESFTTPLLVRWPGVVDAGSVDEHLVQNIDLAPTLLAAAGVDAPEWMQGTSLVPLLHGEDPDDWRDALYYRYYEYPRPHAVPPHYGVRTQGHKLIHYPDSDCWELFDLERDPAELKSVADDPGYAELRKTLSTRLDALRTQFGDTE